MLAGEGLGQGHGLGLGGGVGWGSERLSVLMVPPTLLRL